VTGLVQALGHVVVEVDHTRRLHLQCGIRLGGGWNRERVAETHESNGTGQDEDASDERGIVLGVPLAVMLLPVTSGHGQIVHG